MNELSSMEDKNKIGAAEILEKIADGWESGQYEWIRGNYYQEVRTSDGQKVPGYCSIGALQYKGIPDIDETVVAAQEALARAILPDIPAELREEHPKDNFIVHWNDHIATNKAEVADRFKRAAKDLRNEAGVTL